MFVTEYEKREAARKLNYTYEEWCALPYQERITGIAQLRVTDMIEAHVSDAISQAKAAESTAPIE